MAGPVRISILASGSQARREFAQTSAAAGKMGSKLGSALKGAGVLALAAAGAAAVQFGKDTISAASDAQQSLGATEAVFGKFSKSIIKQSRNAAQEVGLSANEYRELANVTGAMLSSAGTPLRKVTDLTGKLTERAADMAATFGGDAKDAMESINALLRGETDPIEKYGVAIKQSDINARLAAKGLDDLSGSAKKQAEQQARLELLFKQTSRTAGQFADESDTLAGQQQRLSAGWDDLKASIGTNFLPVATKAVGWLNKTAVPALGDFADAVKDVITGKSGGALGKSLIGNLVDNAKNAWDSLKLVWDGIKKGWDNFTGSVRSAIEKHGPMLRQLGDGLETVASSARDILGPALKWVAETGLTQMGRNFENVMDLIKVAGNMFFGFSDVVVGVMGSVVESVTDMSSMVIDGFVKIAEAADLLPGVDLRDQIIGLKDLSNDVEGFGDAFKRGSDKVREGLSEQRWEWNLTSREAALLGNRIRLLPDEVETKVKTPGLVKSFDDVRRLRRQYDLSPDEVVTVIEASGVRLTQKELQRLNKQYDLTPSQVATLIKQTGAGTTIGELKRVLKQADITGKDVRVVLKALGIDLTLKEFRKVGDDGRKLSAFVAKPSVNPDTSRVGPAVRSTNEALNGIPDETVWVNIRPRHVGGGGATSSAPGENPFGRTTAAITEAADKGSRDAIARILRNITSGLPAIKSALDKLEQYIRKSVDLKNDKNERLREKAILKGLKDQYKALIKNGKAQDANNKKLDAARDKLKQIVQASKAFAKGIKDSIVSFGDITNLGRNEDGTVSITNLLDQMRDKVADAKRFSNLIQQLTATGLNQTSIQQLLAAGPEAALATAEAIAAGGQSAIAEVNQLQSQLAQTGTQLGNTMADEFYSGGIKAAEALVAGLEAKQKELDRIAKRLGRKLAQAIRKALRDAGVKTSAQDLGLSLDETTARTQGQRAGRAFAEGLRSTNYVDAYMRGGQARTQSAPINITINAQSLSTPEQIGKYVSKALDRAGAVGTRRMAYTR